MYTETYRIKVLDEFDLLITKGGHIYKEFQWHGIIKRQRISFETLPEKYIGLIPYKIRPLKYRIKEVFKTNNYLTVKEIMELTECKSYGTFLSTIRRFELRSTKTRPVRYYKK